MVAPPVSPVEPPAAAPAEVAAAPSADGSADESAAVTADLSPVREFGELEVLVRDGRIDRETARLRLHDLVPRLSNLAATCPATPRMGWVFPVEGTDAGSIGGTHGEGYKPAGYDWFDGTRHGGHPAQDIFIADTDQDSRLDATGQPVRVLSMTGGIVASTWPAWDPASDLRGGVYAWIWEPASGSLFYYAHLGQLSVQPGDCVAAGTPLGTLGRTGKNAAPPRSPTHLHVMALSVVGGVPRPFDLFQDLLPSRRALHATPPAPVTPWLSPEPEPLDASNGAAPTYAWRAGSGDVGAEAPPAGADTVAGRHPLPTGWTPAPEPPGSFAAWLAGLPLLPAGSPVLLHDGRPKARQDVHASVIAIDVGKRDLQQCADAAMRLRAEYLFSTGAFDRIRFNFTSGDEAAWSRWLDGWRPTVQGNSVRWSRSARTDASWKTFRSYLDTVFNYAGSWSLERSLVPVEDEATVLAGDVFIQGGFPGHAVMVLRVTAPAADGSVLVLLAQSYMPAQQVHVLRNPLEPERGPWFRIPYGERLETPEWVFPAGSLRRWKD